MSFSVTVLGTATPHPLPDRACSGYLLTAGDTRVWVDAGPGTLAHLQRHTRLHDVDAIWISHLHLDHCGDLLAAFYALAYGNLGPRTPIPVYAPAGLERRLSGFFDRPNMAELLAPHFTFSPLEDGHHVVIGDISLRAAAVDHGVEAYGLRAEHSGKTLAFTGDTGPCPALDQLSQGVDVLLCESEADRRESDEPQVHHTPEDAGALAARAGVKRLLVTHVGPTLTPETATTRASSVFGGPTTRAQENQTYRIG